MELFWSPCCSASLGRAAASHRSTPPAGMCDLCLSSSSSPIMPPAVSSHQNTRFFSLLFFLASGFSRSCRQTALNAALITMAITLQRDTMELGTMTSRRFTSSRRRRIFSRPTRREGCGFDSRLDSGCRLQHRQVSAGNSSGSSVSAGGQEAVKSLRL